MPSACASNARHRPFGESAPEALSLRYGVSSSSRSAPPTRHSSDSPSRVDHEVGAAQVEGVGELGGDEVLVQTGGRVRFGRGDTFAVAAGAGAHEHPDPAPGQRLAWDTGVAERGVAALQEHPDQRVHVGGVGLADAEVVGVEFLDPVEEAAPSADAAAGLGPRLVQRGHVPAVGGHLAYGADAVAQQLPVRVQCGGARVATGHADDRHVLVRGRGGSHGARRNRFPGRNRGRTGEVVGECLHGVVFEDHRRRHRAA
jgi:hypothetical protein